MHDLSLLYFPDYAGQASDLAKQLGIACQAIDLHRFPDQESRITLPAIDSKRVAIYLSLDHPDHKLVELMLTCATLTESGVQSIILIAPYLCYMRQDIAFQPGQAVSQRIIGKFLASLVDVIITVDPHLHRTTELGQAVPAKQAIALSSTRLQADFISRHYQDAILVGPDQESEQWVSRIAAYSGLDYLVAAKQRLGDRSVHIELPAADVSGRQVLLIDDMVSTGHTLANCAHILQQRQATKISALVTHALFSQQAEEHLARAGITEISSTDSINHHSNRIRLAPLLVDCLQNLI
jgi:ribose-phosphate pyrophosphokinase